MNDVDGMRGVDPREDRTAGDTDGAEGTPPRAGPVSARASDGSPVPSPCVRVCLYDPASGVCQGCHRTLDEITDWPIYTPDEQREVVARAARRAASARA